MPQGGLGRRRRRAGGRTDGGGPRARPLPQSRRERGVLRKRQPLRSAIRAAPRVGGRSDGARYRDGDVRAEVSGDRVRLFLPPPRTWGSGRGRCRHPPFGTVDLSRRAAFRGLRRRCGGSALESWGPAVRGSDSFGAEGTNLDLVEVRPDATLVLRPGSAGWRGDALVRERRRGGRLRLQGFRRGGRLQLLPASGIPLRSSCPETPRRRKLQSSRATHASSRGTAPCRATIGF